MAHEEVGSSQVGETFTSIKVRKIMKLFLLTFNGEICGYDSHAQAVIRAEDEVHARKLAYNSFHGDELHVGKDCWLNAEYTSCVEVNMDGASEVIIVSPT